jgi:hypothetical protein
MGLDQYLYASKYTSPAEWRGEAERKVFNDILKSIDGEKFVDTELPSLTVDLKVGYWRKANQIHQWFVKNVQSGEDNCAEYWVDRDKLIELRDLCKLALKEKNKADELLPTQSGFFFGSTEIDEWYWQDVESTIEIIDKCLKMDDTWSFKYQSSW